MLALDDIAVHVDGVDDLELVLDAEVRDLPPERHLVVAEAALLALERGHDDLFEERDLSEQETGSAVLLAVHAERGDFL